jgi:putative membrane protein
MIGVTDLPTVNAGLNATAAVLIATGFYFIKQKNIRAHKVCMVAALAVSTLFLTSYVIYHYNVGSVRFTKQGWIRGVYFPLLISHVILAALVLPMVLRTTYLAFKGRFPQHVAIARWTFPVWMYVSITGVIVYVMLYQQKFVGAVRLGTEQDFRAEQEELSVSHARLEDGGRACKMLLPPGPTAAQRSVGIK